MFGDPDPGVPAYGDCGNDPTTCADGICLTAGLGTWAVCTPTCINSADCVPPPVTGTATLTCVDVAGAPGNECLLDCSNGETCPDGMICNEAEICAWDQLP